MQRTREASSTWNHLGRRHVLRIGVVLVAMVGAWILTTHPAYAGESAGWSVIPHGQLRDRLIIDSGRDFLASTGPAHRRYLTQRARLGTTAHHQSGLTLHVTVQDVRVWGEESDPTAFSGKGLDAREAWAAMTLPADVTLTVGRQGLSWDQERILGRLDWTQRSRVFDALRLDWQRKDLQVQAFVAHLSADTAQAEADGHATAAPGTGKVLTGIHAALQVQPGWRTSALYLLRTNELTHEVRHTAGLFTSTQGADWPVQVTAEAYGQFGDLGAQKISAYMGALRLGHAWTAAYKPAISLFAEVVSGDRTAQGAFDTLYGTNHRYYGEMDFFLDLPKQTSLLGLVDTGATVTAKPLAWLAGQVDWHLMRTARQEMTAASYALGHEVDVKLTATVNKHLSVQVFWGVFSPDEAMRAVRKLPAGTALQTEQLGFVTVDTRF